MNEYHAKTLKGLEHLLAGELEEIGASGVQPVNRGVNFKGSVAMLYKANLYLRTALRILVPIARFRISDEEMLYRKIKSIDWSAYMTYKNTLAVDAVTFSKLFRNNHFVELRVKDAIVDQFRERTSLRPSVDIKNAEIRINVHIQDAFVTLSLDSSGQSLHKRGYRKALHPASLSEVLAAGLVMLSGWKGEVPLVNPMCGSGTIAIEAAMIAAGIYPAITGRTYAFQHWPDFDETMFESLLDAIPAPRPLKVPVIATDSDPEAVRITKSNARFLEFGEQFITERMDFLASEETGDQGVLIMNPPYGERLKVEDIDKLYSGIGTTLKHRYTGWSAWLFSANQTSLKHIGLKPDRKIPLFNGPLESSYQKYTIFKGGRKQFKASST